MNASVAHRAITTKCQVHEVRSALDLLGKFTVLEAANQMGAAVWSVIDVQEIIVGLNAEAATKKETNKIPNRYFLLRLNLHIVQRQWQI